MNVAVIGFGTVGKGAYEVIRNGKTDLHVTKILDLSVQPGMEEIMTVNFDDILSDPTIDAVAEVIGGLHPAYEFVTAAMKADKHAVTANKLMVSTYYRELMRTAKENGVQFRFTPAAGGGIPWLSNLKRTARADRIVKIEGILNGTTNFILDKMTREGAEFDAVLAEAQALGYAEKDPTADIDGYDVRCKCVLSSNLASRTVADPQTVPTLGIRAVKAGDVARLKELGRTLKLLATVIPGDETQALFVQPVAVKDGSLFAAVPTNFNLIRVIGETVGPLAFFGQGAGKDPTGFAVVQDLLDIAEGQHDTPYEPRTATVDTSNAFFRYYVRTPDVSPELAKYARSCEKTEDGTVVFTNPISVETMHGIAANLPKPTFVAALPDEE